MLSISHKLPPGVQTPTLLTSCAVRSCLCARVLLLLCCCYVSRPADVCSLSLLSQRGCISSSANAESFVFLHVSEEYTALIAKGQRKDAARRS